MNVNIQKILSYIFPFPSLLIVNQSKLHCKQTTKPSNLIYNNGIKTISQSSHCLQYLTVQQRVQWGRGRLEVVAATTVICCLLLMCRRSGGGWRLYQRLRDSAVSSHTQTPALSLSSVTSLLCRSLKTCRAKGDRHPRLFLSHACTNRITSISLLHTLLQVHFLCPSLLRLFDVYLCWWRERRRAECNGWGWGLVTWKKEPRLSSVVTSAT